MEDLIDGPQSNTINGSKENELIKQIKKENKIIRSKKKRNQIIIVKKSLWQNHADFKIKNTGSNFFKRNNGRTDATKSKESIKYDRWNIRNKGN